MFKKALVIAIFLGVLDTNAVEIQQKIQTPDVDQHDFQQIQIDNEEDAIRKGNVEDAEALLLSEDAEAGGVSCNYGIQRWGHSSNSYKTFQAARRGSRKWTDPGFPANNNALYWKGMYTSYTQSDIQTWLNSRVIWVRPNQYKMISRPSLWGSYGKPLPQGISQGMLGDCWFLSGAAAVAEVPGRIKNVIQSNSYEKNGIFRFYFWQKNKWHGINIDDRLPARKQYGNYYPFFTKPSDAGKALWMPLMEKAYAKFDQTYERIVGGNGFESMRVLTGMPTTGIAFKGSGVSESKLYAALYGLAKKNYPMTTSCCTTSPGYGNLYSGHAYTLLDVFTLSNGQRMAKIRNPHDNEKYNGAYNDNDRRWTSKLAREAGLKRDTKDGVFHMPFNKYYTTFNSANVALYQKYGGYKQFNVNSATSRRVFTISNPTNQEFYAVAEGYSRRNFPRTCTSSVKTGAFQVIMYGANGRRVPHFDNFTPKYDYGWSQVGGQGWGIAGKINKVQRKGTYKLYVTPDSRNKISYTVHVYWKNRQGTIRG